MSFTQRIISSIAMGVILIVSIYYQRIGLITLMICSQLMIIHEISSIPISSQFFKLRELIGAVSLAIFTSSLFIEQYLPALIAVIIFSFISLTIIFSLKGSPANCLATFVRFLLNSFISGILITIGHFLILNQPTLFLTQLFLVIINDSFAYFCGKLFGKHKLITLSPSKTWEGFVGGGVFTLCLAKPVYLVCNLMIQADQQLLEVVAVQAIFVATVAPIGGFFGSLVKRSCGIQDFGKVIPGHGGFLDRLDCQILTFSVSYFAWCALAFNE
ncbi:Phosphatidate cytidylyltransferase [Spironucleus salmonicida]|uniref:phosphatidate cytidylyltransferase n=1 Tax=Spironucleus salmonicida TaxID=348837 RepID=V6LH70_9EUKA|nr:Phosphatidate cytidylyltransferase [Spironucleus salmonicida]|eukprot:EST43905.1 Phosphatidate cytidylyltransferase [Spironucleus salmonicida]